MFYLHPIKGLAKPGSGLGFSAPEQPVWMKLDHNKRSTEPVFRTENEGRINTQQSSDSCGGRESAFLRGNSRMSAIKDVLLTLNQG